MKETSDTIIFPRDSSRPYCKGVTSTVSSMLQSGKSLYYHASTNRSMVILEQNPQLDLEVDSTGSPSCSHGVPNTIEVGMDDHSRTYYCNLTPLLNGGPNYKGKSCLLAVLIVQFGFVFEACNLKFTLDRL